MNTKKEFVQLFCCRRKQHAVYTAIIELNHLTLKKTRRNTTLVKNLQQRDHQLVHCLQSSHHGQHGQCGQATANRSATLHVKSVSRVKVDDARTRSYIVLATRRSLSDKAMEEFVDFSSRMPFLSLAKPLGIDWLIDYKIASTSISTTTAK